MRCVPVRKPERHPVESGKANTRHLEPPTREARCPSVGVLPRLEQTNDNVRAHEFAPYVERHSLPERTKNVEKVAYLVIWLRQQAVVPRCALDSVEVGCRSFSPGHHHLARYQRAACL